ncbi:MAG: hypothetical protein GF408_05275 [Candidatus Omnitrophica bacterium]|nr:hypothetical protein [Candidatus Omnitrophota bacterium]
MRRSLQYRNFIPEFDSSSSMLFSLGNYLFGREEAVGLPPKLPRLLGDIINMTPVALRKSGYRIGGIKEAVGMRALKNIRDKDISNWIIDAYPRRKYPAIVIGSSNGALTHLCCMLGVPWIPQTVLVAVRRLMDPDELKKDAAWGQKAAAVLKESLPDFRLHQMHDPIQDRIMITNMGYFRIKRLRLGEILENYIKETLMPGGTIFISDCDYKWPCKKIDGKHYFQTGGFGDVSGEEYAEGSERIEKFLAREGSKRKKWDVPGPLEDVPEGEWGYAPELEDDIKKLALKNNFKVRRIKYPDPTSLSPAAAEMTRKWYEMNGIEDTGRYLIECFALIEPLQAARTGSVPYWMAFNTKTSFGEMQKYMDGVKELRELYVMIMSNAVEGVGFVPLSAWKDLMKKAEKRGAFIGIGGKQYPFDLGSFIKYYKDLKKKITDRYFLPHSLTLDEFTGLFKKMSEKHDVELKRVYLK